MEVIIVVLAFVSLISISATVRAKRELRNTLAGDPPEVPAHRMVRTFHRLDTPDHLADGWWYQCSCGMEVPARTKHNEGSNEVSAVIAWKAHSKLYRGIPQIEGGWQEKYELLKVEYEDYKEKCFCKTIAK